MGAVNCNNRPMSEPSKTPRKRRQPRKVTQQSLHNAALHYLERYASSADNLRRVLMRRVRRSALVHDTDPEEGARLIDELVTRFEAAGLLDDRAYAAARVTSLRRRGASSRAIAMGLRQKGVAAPDIAAALAEHEAEVENEDLEFIAACRLAQRRRLGPFRPSDKVGDFRQRDLAALARAGFAYDIARRVIDHDTAADLAELIAKANL